jgi:hypothetical protein
MYMAGVGSYVMSVLLSANSYAGAFFQLLIGLMGAFGLRNFIVVCKFGGVGFMFYISSYSFFLCDGITLF